VTRLVRFTLLWLVALVLIAPAALASAHPNRIVFQRDGDLYALRLGHHPVRLTNTTAHEHQPAWSPTQREVAFAVGRHAVGVLDVATGRRRVIASVPDRFDEIGAVTWSPSGTSIDFSAMNNFRLNGKYRLNGTVWTVSPNGFGLHRIVNGQGLITGLGFLADGTSVFESTEWPNGVTLWHPHAPLGVNAFRPDGSDLHPVSKTLASDLDTSDVSPRLVYRGWSKTCHGCGEIWRMSTDGSGAHVIALPPKGYYGLYEPRFLADRTSRRAPRGQGKDRVAVDHAPRRVAPAYGASQRVEPRLVARP
jgi:Tol biopolymer transport system component